MYFDMVSAFLVSVILSSLSLYSHIIPERIHLTPLVFAWSQFSSYSTSQGNMRSEMQISSPCHHPKDLCILHICLLGKFISWPTSQWFLAMNWSARKPKKSSSSLLSTGPFSFFDHYNSRFCLLFRMIKPCLIFNSEYTSKFCRAILRIIFEL